MGTPIHAAANGTVIFAGKCSGYGNAIIIDHGNGYVTLYGHMKKRDIKVKVGDRVKNNQEIAKVGNEGGSTGPHLHVEYIYNSDGSNTAFWSKKGEKNKHVYDPRTINDLQDILDGKEEFTGEFLEGGSGGSVKKPQGLTEDDAIELEEVIIDGKQRPYTEEENNKSNPFQNGPEAPTNQGSSEPNNEENK